MSELVLPEPQQVAAAHVSEICDQAAEIRTRALAQRDDPLALELWARLRGYERYVQDAEAKRALAAEARLAEVVIGKLLPKQQGKPLPETFRKLDDRYRHDFRLMAEYEQVVERCLSPNGNSKPKTARSSILKAIDEDRTVPVDRSELEVRVGDFRDVLADVHDVSVDLILTDPPYAEDTIDLYGHLGEFAARKLKDGGSLVAYCGQGTLPLVFDRLREHLRYWWTFSVTHEGGGQRFPGKWVNCEWKPLVWFVKDSRRGTELISDRLRGTRTRKELHDWAQAKGELEPLITGLTSPDDLIVDPFAGSGTTGEAALDLGRRFVGADVRG